MKTIFRICAMAMFGAGSVWAGSPLRVPVHFAITNDAGLGYEWFVVGGHPDVGAWDPAKAIKLVWSDGNVWWGDVGVQAGTALEYKFVKRSTAPGDVCDSGNGDWWPAGDNLATNVPADAVAGGRKIHVSDLVCGVCRLLPPQVDTLAVLRRTAPDALDEDDAERRAILVGHVDAVEGARL